MPLHKFLDRARPTFTIQARLRQAMGLRIPRGMVSSFYDWQLEGQETVSAPRRIGHSKTEGCQRGQRLMIRLIYVKIALGLHLDSQFIPSGLAVLGAIGPF